MPGCVSNFSVAYILEEVRAAMQMILQRDRSDMTGFRHLDVTVWFNA